MQTIATWWALSPSAKIVDFRKNMSKVQYAVANKTDLVSSNMVESEVITINNPSGPPQLTLLAIKDDSHTKNDETIRARVIYRRCLKGEGDITSFLWDIVNQELDKDATTWIDDCT